MRSKQFYLFPTTTGNIMVNINNIASIEATPTSGCKVTLNVKDATDKFINFVSLLNWGTVTGEIMALDNMQKKDS